MQERRARGASIQIESSRGRHRGVVRLMLAAPGARTEAMLTPSRLSASCWPTIT